MEKKTMIVNEAGNPISSNEALATAEKQIIKDVIEAFRAGGDKATIYFSALTDHDEITLDDLLRIAFKK